MFKRKIEFNNKEYAIAIYSIWYKYAIENNFTKFKDIKWRLSVPYLNIMLVCSICKGILYIFLFFLLAMSIEHMPWYKYDINLFFVFLNMLVLIGPILLIELIIMYLIPIEVKDNKD